MNLVHIPIITPPNTYRTFLENFGIFFEICYANQNLGYKSTVHKIIDLKNLDISFVAHCIYFHFGKMHLSLSYKLWPPERFFETFLGGSEIAEHDVTLTSFAADLL